MKYTELKDELENILSGERYLVPQSFWYKTRKMDDTLRANILAAGVLVAYNTVKNRTTPSIEFEMIHKETKYFVPAMEKWGMIENDGHYLRHKKALMWTIKHLKYDIVDNLVSNSNFRIEKHNPDRLMKLYKRKLVKVNPDFKKKKVNNKYDLRKFELDNVDTLKLVQSNLGDKYTDKVRIYNNLTQNKGERHNILSKELNNYTSIDITSSQIQFTIFLMNNPDALNDTWNYIKLNYAKTLDDNLSKKRKNEKDIEDLRRKWNMALRKKTIYTKPTKLTFGDLKEYCLLNDMDVKHTVYKICNSSYLKLSHKERDLVDKYPEFKAFIKRCIKIHPSLPHYLFAAAERRLMHNRITPALLDAGIAHKILHDAIFFEEANIHAVLEIIDEVLDNYYDFKEWCGGNINCLFHLEGYIKSKDPVTSTVLHQELLKIQRRYMTPTLTKQAVREQNKKEPIKDPLLINT